MLAKLKVSIGVVRKVHVSRDDSRVLLLTSDNKLMTYDFDLIKNLIARGQLDAANLKPLVSVSPHKKQIIDVVVPEGEESIALTLSQDNTVKVTDLNTGAQLADIFLEDVPSCFCSVMAALIKDFLGTSVFVGFVDGKIRRYNYLQNAMDLTLESEKDASGAIVPKLEPQEPKALLEVRHKGKVTAIAYVPEIKEIVSSGSDDMLFMFTPSGVTTFSSGKFKCSFDFMQLIQRPASMYLSSHFGTNTIKSKMLVKAFNKTTIDRIAGDAIVRTFVPLKKINDQQEDENLIRKKQAKRGASSLLDVFEECLLDRAPQSTGNGKAPLLKKREIEELEAENAQLKQRLLTLADVNKHLLKRVKSEQGE